MQTTTVPTSVLRRMLTRFADSQRSLDDRTVIDAAADVAITLEEAQLLLGALLGEQGFREWEIYEQARAMHSPNEIGRTFNATPEHVQNMIDVAEMRATA